MSINLLLIYIALTAVVVGGAACFVLLMGRGMGDPAEMFQGPTPPAALPESRVGAVAPTGNQTIHKAATWFPLGRHLSLCRFSRHTMNYTQLKRAGARTTQIEDAFATTRSIAC